MSDKPETREVCDASELKNGQLKEVPFGEGKVLLSKLDGKIYATSSQCSHYGAPLAKGVLTGSGRVVCPWHGACFNVKTGDIEDSPGLDSLHSYEAKLSDDGGKILVTASVKTVESKKGRIPARDRKSAVKGTKEGGEAAGRENERVVIIGGGSGGVGVVEGLRENGYTGKITMVTSEPHGPIDRTKLSKTLMYDVSKLAIRDYTEAPFSVDLRTSTEVTKLDLDGNKVTLETGEEISYNQLVVATGASPNALPVDGGDLKGILKLRSVDQAKKCAEAVVDGARIVLVGSSFISMEVAVCASKKKLASLDVIGMEEYPMQNVLGEEIGKGMKAYHEKQGVKFHMNSGVDGFIPSSTDSSKVGAVKLKDGSEISCDAVILGIGAKPNTTLLKDAGIELEKDSGVVVDEHLRIKGRQNVFAIGDIAHYPFNGEPVRIEHWNVAQNHGRCVASTIAAPSQAQPFSKQPLFWSAQGAQLRYAGHAKGFDDVLVKGDAEGQKFEAYYAKGDTILAVASMGVDPLVSKTTELMRLDMMPTFSQVKNGEKGIFDVDITSIAA